MEKINVVDNFVDKDFQNFIEKELLGDNFPLYLNRSTIFNPYQPVPEGCGYKELPAQVDTIQFTHAFVKEGNVTSDSWDFIYPIAYKFSEMLDEPLKTVRCKMNVTLPKAGFTADNHSPVHRDQEESMLVAIYYINDSDGDTLIFDNDYNIIQRVQPKKGRLLYFENDVLHAGQVPTNTDFRGVINFNFRRM